MPYSSRRVLKRFVAARAPVALALKPVAPPVEPEAEAASPEEDPREAAEKLLATARAEAGRLRQEAYEEGLARGLAEAAGRVEAELARARERAAGLIRQAEAERRATLDALEGEIIDLVRAVAEKVVLQELSVNPELVVGAAREALALLRDRQAVILFCHPEDAPLLRERQEELAALLPAGAVLRVIEDPDIGRGGVLADSGEGLVDARLDTRWRAVLDALLGEGA
ncbi:MAG: FliH/SctL family protein [Bacillota bacterium]